MVATIQPHLLVAAASPAGWQPWRALPACTQQQARPRPPLALPARQQRWAALTHAARKAAQPECTALKLVVSAPTPQTILQSCSSAYPDWAQNGYRLLKGGAQVPDAPSPSEAAAILKAVAKRALKLLRVQRAVLLQRHRVVLGLVECLQLVTSGGAPSRSGSTKPSTLSGSAASVPSSIDAATGAAASEVAAASTAAAAVSYARPALAPAELSGAMWSLSVLGEDEYFEGEMEALAAQLPGTEFDRLLQVADVCWALATARHWSPHLAVLEERAERLIAEKLHATCPSSTNSSSRGSSGPATCAQVSTVVWGLSVLGHPPLRLLGQLPRLLQQWEQQDRLCQKAEAGDGSAASDSGGSLGSWPGQGSPHRPAVPFPSLCSLAWSMAVAGQAQHEACRLVLAALAHRCCGGASAAGSRDGTDAGPLPDVGRKQLMQLQQVSLALGGREATLQWVLSCPAGAEEEEEEEGLASEAAAALQQLLARAEGAAESLAGNARNRKVSACQADVAATLVSLGLPFIEECQVAPGLVVDAAVPSLQLAVEVDGPSHFTRNLVPLNSRQGSVGCRQPMGATLLKHHLLRRSGWTVAHVDTAEWERLRGPEQKREHLEGVIRRAGAAVEG